MGSELRNEELALPVLTVRPARESDISIIAGNLRREDRDEIDAASGIDPFTVIAHGFVESSPCMVAEFQGVPGAIFGVVPSPPEGMRNFPRMGHIWMLGTEAVPVFKRPFLRHSKEWLDIITQDYDLVGNVVDSRNVLHVRWLKWLGFHFLRTIHKYGYQQLPFKEFAMIVEKTRV